MLFLQCGLERCLDWDTGEVVDVVDDCVVVVVDDAVVVDDVVVKATSHCLPVNPTSQPQF